MKTLRHSTIVGDTDAKCSASGMVSESSSTPHTAYRFGHGVMVQGKAEEVLLSRTGRRYKGKVQLLLTSPPFPLNRKKKYGNLQGEEYIEWLAGFADLFRNLLTPTGSIVIEMGNAWEHGKPVMSTLALRALLRFLECGNLHLCQQFVCYNPARLPGPAQWVNVERIRVKDAYTHVWWMAATDRPYADNRQVLKEYSDAMRSLLEKQTYNAGKRPSEHHIGASSFLRNNEGAIRSNVFVISNTSATDPYQRYCRQRGLRPHPARMPRQMAEFFVKFLSRPWDLVVDPFAGSNTTGATAEELGRRWLAIEPDGDYVAGSIGRFIKPVADQT